MPAVRPKFHLVPCSEFRSHLNRARTLRCACSRLKLRPRGRCMTRKYAPRTTLCCSTITYRSRTSPISEGTTPLVTLVKGRSRNAAPRVKSKTVLAPSKGLGDFAAENRSYRKQSRRFGCQWPAENHDLVGLTIGRSRVPGDRRRLRTGSTGGPRAVTRAGVGTCDQPPLPPRVMPPVSLPKTAAVWKNRLRSEPCLPPSSSAMAVTVAGSGDTHASHRIRFSRGWPNAPERGWRSEERTHGSAAKAENGNPQRCERQLEMSA
jgi:hypothetical protein